jgi:hypothetical protein
MSTSLTRSSYLPNHFGILRVAAWCRQVLRPDSPIQQPLRFPQTEGPGLLSRGRAWNNLEHPNERGFVLLGLSSYDGPQQFSRQPEPRSRPSSTCIAKSA